MKRFFGSLVVLVLFALIAQLAFAAALSDNRDTPVRAGRAAVYTQGSNTIYAGAMVAVNASGVAVPAADSSGLAVVGCAAEKSDNTGSSYSSSETIEVLKGIFRWANGNSLDDGDIGSIVYAMDDQTVKSSGVTNFVIAGSVVDVDADGVWVETGSIAETVEIIRENGTNKLVCIVGTVTNVLDADVNN